MIKDPQFRQKKAQPPQPPYGQCKELDLKFLRYHVMGIAGRARGSLLLTFLANLEGQLITVNCWIELGNGHKYLRGANKGHRLPQGHFRVTDDTLLYHWMIEMNLEPKNWGQSHIGFKKKLKSTAWRGKVILVTRKDGTPEFKTHISVLTRLTAHDLLDTDRSANDDMDRWLQTESKNNIPF